MSLRGVVPPLITPFDGAGNVDIKSLHALIDHVIDAGVHALFVLGSTGEGTSMTEMQVCQVITEACTAARQRVPVLVGVSSSVVSTAIALGRFAAEAGADMLVAAAPYYYAHSQSETADFFRTLKNAVDLPLCAYNIPSAVKIELEPDMLRQLAAESVIAALKDSGSNISSFRRSVLTLGIPVLTGSQDIIDAQLLMGAAGMVPGAANTTPRPFVELYEAAQKADWAAARAIQERLLPLLQIRSFGGRELSTPSAALGAHKTALKLMGIIRSNQVLPPLKQLSAEAESKIEAVFREQGIL